MNYTDQMISLMHKTTMVDLKCLFFLMVIAYHTIDANLCMENDSPLPRPRIVIIGSRGVGKSSLANSLMGRHPLDDREIIQNLTRFKDGCFYSPWQGYYDKTTYTCYDQGPFLGNLPRNLSRPTYPNVTVVDTPGFGDADTTSELQMVMRLVEVLKKDIKCVDAFVICFNKNKVKSMDKAMANLLTFFEEMYGKSFWEHAILEITFYAHHALNLTINDEEENKIEGVVNDMLKRELDVKLDLNAIFIDSHYHDKYPEESVAFAKNAKRLFEFANDTKPLSTKGIDFVLTELQRKQTMFEDYKNTIENLTNTIEKLENDLMNLRRNGTVSNLTSDTNSQHALHATPILFGFGIIMCILVTTMIG